jgi:glycine/D-amino acid oxidase-like deaminating enzyme
MYDPLLTTAIPSHQPYPDSYWRSTIDNPRHFSAIDSAKTTDVVVIGGGYTGLTCAYQLAQRYQRNVVLLEANDIAWGCSGRNGGFVLSGTGRLSIAAIEKRFGRDIALKMHKEYETAISWTNELIDLGKIACEPQRFGYLKVAHKKAKVNELKQQAHYLQQQFNSDVRFIDAKELSSYIKLNQGFGALYTPHNFAVNPLKLSLGYADLAQQAGVELHCNSPVIGIEDVASHLNVITPSATIRCKKVVIASNGYTPKQFHTSVANRTLPVLSSIIVTRPLTAEELTSCGFSQPLQAMDTRELKYYYRLLPDNRILFGGRGAIRGKNANNPIYKQRLMAALKNTFTGINDVTTDYFWSGWISVSLDDLPRIWAENNVYYSQGYCGSGVSFSGLAGKRLAEKVMGELDTQLPIYASPLKTFPMAPMRRIGQWGFYQWGRFKDAFL